MLFLLRVPDGASPGALTAADFDFTLLDQLVNLVVGEFGLDLGFEIMGNPLFASATSDQGVFTSFKDPAQIKAWEMMVNTIAQRYTKQFGVDTVARWRWEGWK
jgi:hypothetical protein